MRALLEAMMLLADPHYGKLGVVIIVTDGKGVFDAVTNLNDASMARLCAITAQRVITGRTSNETYDPTKPTGMVS
jgi:hypothetical protein